MPDGLTEDLNLGPQTQPIGGGQNPISTLSSLAQLQNTFNQNRMFQQTFAARQRLGEIISQAPDPETGWTQAMQDPLVAPFAGEAYTSYRQGQVALQQYANAKQEGVDSGIKIALTGAMAGLADPSTVVPNVKARLAALPAENRASVAPAVSSIVSSLTDGLPKDPTLAKAMYQQRLTALGIGSGIMNPGGVNAILGTPSTQDTGGGIQAGVTLPPQLGGGFSPATQTQKTLAPQLVEPGRTAVGGAAGAPGAATPGATPPAANSLGGGANPVGASGISLSTRAGDGTLLIPPGTAMKSPTTAGATGGLSALQYQGAQDLTKDFNGKELDQYDSAVQTKGQLPYITDALDAAAKAGGILAPGSLNGLRTNLAKMANTFSEITGQKPPVDPEAIGKIEDANKITNWLGFQLVKQFEGAGREAASTIHTGITSVPGLNNTLLGGKLMADSLGAMSQNMIDRRQFKQEWAQQNGGNLTNADETFNKLHPADQYAQSVLGKYGLSSQGFTDPGAVKSALSNGLLTREQAKSALLSQFPDQFHSAAPGGQ